LGPSRTVALCCLCVVVELDQYYARLRRSAIASVSYLAVLALPHKVGFATAALLLVHFLRKWR
jgi:hypothetical protein